MLEDPTTLSIVEDWIYVTGNSQPGKYDDTAHSIKEEAKEDLSDLKIIKIKIKDGG